MQLHHSEQIHNQNAAVKLTRSQLAKQAELEAEPKSLVDGIGQTPEEQESTKEERTESHIKDTEINTIQTAEDNDISTRSLTQTPIDTPTSPMATAIPNVIAQLRKDSPTKRSTSNKENVEPDSTPETTERTPSYDALEEAVVAARTPTTEARLLTPRPEDHIAALDELDEAVENINKDIPHVQTSPEKPKVKREKVAPVVRTTKASQARISMSQKQDAASRGPTLGRPRPSTTLGRSNSVRQSGTTRSDSTSQRNVSATSKEIKTAANGERKEVVIPHSKPRPVSLSFPTPPPPPKSTKPPTQSTFQLPGEAVAAKLKAAREARMQKEAEQEEKKSTFKARPVPTALSKAPSVRQTTASRARESVMNGMDLRASTSTSSSAPHKRAHSVAITLSAAPKPCVTSNDSTKAASASTKPAPGDLAVRKRPSTALANMSKPRISLTTAARAHASTAPGADRVPSNPTKGTVKGKEVFNRAAAAKAAAEKEKLEKEAAAKKARAEAAERGRQASREWAEKQKQKSLASKGGKVTSETTAANTTPVQPAWNAAATVEPVAVN